jgi:hypothetical protein
MTDAAPAPAPTPADAPAPAAPADHAALAARDAELTQLYESDPHRYQYENGGKFANEHLAIRKAQQAQTGDDGTDHPADDGLEVDDIDLDVEPVDAEDEEPSEAGEVEASTDEAVGVDSYAPPAIEGVSWNDDALKPIVDVAARHGVSQAALTEALSAYGEAVRQQQAKLAEMDRDANKATAAALTERLGSKEAYDGYVATAREAARLMPKPLRDALKAARLPNGQRVLHMPELAEFLHTVASSQGQATPAQPQGGRAAMQAELRELDQLMSTDIDAYHRQWRGTGQSGSQRRLEIMRELASEAPAKPSAADLRAEERELRQLRDRDPQLFMYGSWRGTGRPAADRLVAIQSGRG